MTQKNWHIRAWALPWIGCLALNCVGSGDIDARGSSGAGDAAQGGGGTDYLNCRCNRSADASFVCACGTTTITYRPSGSTALASVSSTMAIGGSQVNANASDVGLGGTASSSASNAMTFTGGSRNVGGAEATGSSGTNPGSSPATGSGGTKPSGPQSSGLGGSLVGGAPATGGARSTICTDTPRPSESCENAIAWGFCGQAWYAGNCDASCGICSLGTGGSRGVGGASSSRGVGGSNAATATGGGAHTTAMTGGSPNTGGSSHASTLNGGSTNAGGSSHTVFGGSSNATGGNNSSEMGGNPSAGGRSNPTSGGSSNAVGSSTRVSSAGASAPE